MSFNKVAVIGAGTMGAGIAGQVANAGIEVLLLDMPSEGEDANAIARRGLERLKDPNQPGLMSDEAEQLVRLGNIRDDFDRLSECDWVAEAVVERLDIKRDLYRRLDATCGENAIITSNTSTIPISLLTERMSESFQQRFAITHFFNPVRFMRLLELVRGEHTSSEVMDRLDAFCEQQLGKGVVRCLDTPGFLGNRVGVYAIQCALHAALDHGLTPVEADAIFGRPMGIPKTGVFGLYDLIGIDLMSDVVKSLVSILPDDDPFHDVSVEVPLMRRMIANGQTGNKQGRGFYKEDAETGERKVLDFESGEYRGFDRLNLPLAERAEQEGVGRLLEDDSKYGRFAWEVLSRTLCYAASLIPEVDDGPLGIDDAMKLGYNWLSGPFEMMDDIGTSEFVSRLQYDKRAVPQFLMSAREGGFYRVDGGRLECRLQDGSWQGIDRPSGVVRFNEKRLTLKPENSNEMASWFVSDEAAVVEFHSKANALDGDSMAILADAISQVTPRSLKGLVVHNDAQHFSCGVNLGTVRRYFEADDMDGLDGFLDHFQKTVLAMRDADYPVVVAPVGLSLGGGFEVVLHGKQVICHANSVMGLVESLVGVVPSGGGCKEILYRWIEKLECGDDISEASWKAFMNIGYGVTATSPILAADLAMLRTNDRYEMNRDRLYSAAIAAMDGSGQAPLHRPDLAMPGRAVFEKMTAWLHGARDKNRLTPHDVVVGSEIARIVTGGDVDPETNWNEQDLLYAERRSFLHLVSTEETRERIRTMLDLGKPVRN